MYLVSSTSSNDLSSGSSSNSNVHDLLRRQNLNVLVRLVVVLLLISIRSIRIAVVAAKVGINRARVVHERSLTFKLGLNFFVEPLIFYELDSTNYTTRTSYLSELTCEI